jgi:hypothetical protein
LGCLFLFYSEMQAVALRVWSGFTSNLQKEPLCLPWAWGPLIDSAWRGPLPDFQVHLPDAHGVCVQHPEHAPQRFTSPQTLPCAQVPGPHRGRGPNLQAGLSMGFPLIHGPGPVRSAGISLLVVTIPDTLSLQFAGVLRAPLCTML